MEYNEQKPKPQGLPWWGARHTLSLLGFLGLSISYCLRVNVSIAVVAMVGTKSGHHSNASLATSGYHGNASLATADSCPRPDVTNEHQVEMAGEFSWDEETQGLVLGSFYYGYILTSFLGGRAAEYLGGRLVFGLGTVLSALLSLLTPLCARADLWLLLACRVLTGMAQGVTVPAIFLLMATWFPPEEKAKFGSFIKGGMQFGTVVTMVAGGWICSLEGVGWPGVFYVFGAAGVVWGVPWFTLVHDRPEHHPRVTRAELDHITKDRSAVKKAEVVGIPWRAMLGSKPVYACLVMAWGASYGFQTLLAEMPSYLTHVQHFDIKSSGWMSAVPYACMWVMGVAWGVVVDWLLLVGHISSIAAVRRLSTAVAYYGPAVALVALCLVDCNAAAVLGLLCVAVGCGGASYSGNALAEQDIAPNLTGTLVGISNTVASAPGFMAPYITGIITQGQQGSLAAWRWVFVISAVTYFLTTTFYLFTMSADVQPWNDPDARRDMQENEEPREKKALVDKDGVEM